MRRKHPNKRLTLEQFEQTVANMNLTPQNIEITRGVLVEGKKQLDYRDQFAISSGAISITVNRVWKAFLMSQLPSGYQKVTAILPKHKAYIVKKWDKETKEVLKQKLSQSKI